MSDEHQQPHHYQQQPQHPQPLTSPRYVSQLYVIPAVDAAEAGKGQLEISVNQGQVPNNVQMQDAGRCLVTFIPQHSGTYMIDVTFNGLQVHGCPIKVDVRERQVGKPVSAPVFARPATTVYGGGAAVAGTSPPTRGPSSAYFSSASPHVDTAFSASSYAPSPSSPPHPRSPPMVASIHSPAEQRRTPAGTSSSDLRSPALVKQQQQQQQQQAAAPKGLLGYTVAQYGSKEKITTTTTTSFQQIEEKVAPSSAISPQRHKYFGEEQQHQQQASPISPPAHRPPSIPIPITTKATTEPSPEAGTTAQFEMTRSAELTLFRERHPSAEGAAAGGGTSASARMPEEEGQRQTVPRREIPIQHIYDRVPDDRVPPHQPINVELTHKSHDLPYAPLDQRARKTVEFIRSQFESPQHGEEEERAQRMPTSTPISPVQSPTHGQIQTHIVEPYSSDIETAMTPGTRRRLLEHSVFKAADLKESPGRQASDADAERRSAATTTDHEESEAPSSRHSSKATTPRLSLKFRGSKDKVAAATTRSGTGEVPGGFDWGKSKISSKHEVVRRGKEVDVRIDGLKLGKEDQLKVVVLPPSLARQPQQMPIDPSAQHPPPELQHKLKKMSTKAWEVSFRPNEVGTHKVLVFVNNIPHPKTPFPIRVYDAAQIAVGDIVNESNLNDTVEFTVDAGRAGFGNLEMAIKDHNGIIIPSHVSQLEAGAAKFLVTFNPSSPGTHTVHITFNKEVIKGSPFEVNIVEPPILGPDGSPMPGKKKKEKKGKDKHSQNGTHSKSSSKEVAAAAAGQIPPVSPPVGQHFQRPSVSKLPSLSRVGKPVELLVTLTRPDDLVQALIYDLERESLPVEIVSDGPTNRRIQFIPKRVGDHDVEIRIGGIEVEGSPFTCRVYDPAKILVGTIPDGTVEKPVNFVVDASQAGVGNLEVAVNEGKIPSMAHALGQHKYEITFVPKEPIDHQISVRFNNEPVPGSPFLCRLVPPVEQQQQPQQLAQRFTASGLGLERVAVGQPTEFFVEVQPTDGTQSPHVESLPRVQITDPRGELLPVDVATYEEEPSRTVVRYMPRSVGNHQISIKWNGQPISGSPFTAKAFDANCVKLALDGDGGGGVGQVGRACTFTIDAAKAGAGNMEIIVSVGRRNVPNYVQAEGQARFRVSFTPQEAEEHMISVKFNGVPVPGSPMRCPVIPAPPRSPRPTRSDSERTADFPFRTGTDDHHLGVPSATTAQHQIVPELVEPEEADLGESAAAHEEEEELRLVGDTAIAQLNHPKRFSIDAPASAGGQVECNVVVVDPQGSPLPVRCYKQQDDSYWVEFTPEVCGTHSIEVTFGNEPIHGSPFSCEVIDPKKVQIRGIDKPFTLRTMGHFIINRKSAGNGPLNTELADPQGETLKMDKVKNSLGEDSFTFVPTKLGVHKLAVKLAGFAIPGSPFSLVVEEQRAPTVYGAALDYAIERGQQASMIFDANKQPGGLKVEVRSPNGERIRHSTNRRPDETTEIAFRPQDVGNYETTIDFNNRPVHGSPFTVAVVDPSKVLVDDRNFRPDGMLQLHLSQPNQIDIDATAAGPAKIRAELRDAEGELLSGDQQAQIHSLGYGKYQLAFRPKRPGKYKIYLYCSELVVPTAYPLLAIAENGGAKMAAAEDITDGIARSGHNGHHPMEEEGQHYIRDIDLSKVILRGEGLTTARIREPAEFIVDASELRKGTVGKCVATLHGERADVPVKVSALKNQVYKGIYTPLLGGTYQLAVQIDGKHVPGSPTTVHVESHSHPAELIEVDERTMKMGIIGEDVRTIIDARRAGPGQISAQCSGPSQLEYCELLDNRDGTYLLRVQPKELGKHTLSIKYENEHVRGSPFTFNVNHPPDPTKVRVYGPGIEHGILHSFKSNFVVETKGAGAGQLTVRVRGPKGAFNVEMQRDRQQERTIHCKYEPREPGDYQVEVKWHGHHVPGSPFFVLIVDTEHELQRFLAGGVPSPTPPSPFVPPGWLPSGPPGIMGHPGPLPIMPPAPMPPPHFSKGGSVGGGRMTPGSSISGGLQVVPMQIHGLPPPHHHHPPPPPHHPHVVPRTVYGKHHY